MCGWCVAQDAGLPFEFGSLSWRLVSRTSLTGTYAFDFCGTYPISAFDPAPTLGSTLGPGMGRTPAGGAPIGYWISTFAAADPIPLACNVTHLYQRGMCVCCTSHVVTFSRSGRGGIELFSGPGMRPSISTASIAAGTLFTESVRLHPILSHGFIDISPTIGAVRHIVLPIQAGAQVGQIKLGITEYEMEYITLTDHIITIKTTQTTAQRAATGYSFYVILLSHDIDGSAVVPNNDERSASRFDIYYAFSSQPINRLPVLLTDTATLRTNTENNKYVHATKHSFVVQASDPDSDPIHLLATGSDFWPTGAIVVPLIPAWTPSPFAEYTDVDYPKISGIQEFRIEWTPTPAQAARNKTWTMCWRASDVLDGISLEQTCLSMYVPSPCPTVSSSILSNGVVSVSSLHYVVDTIVTFACDANYGIVTSNPSIVKRVSASQHTAVCRTTGWDQSTTVQCKALCYLPQLAHGSWRDGVDTLISGDILSYTCDAGYIPASIQQEYQCRDDGTLNVLEVAMCKPVPCPSFNILNGGSIRLNNGTENTTATFDCRAGDVLLGSRTATCSSTGVWLFPSSTPPMCVTPCHDLPLLLANNNNNNNNITIRQLTLSPAAIKAVGNININASSGVLLQAIFACPDNWIMTGSNTSTCGVDGAWNNVETRCTMTCRASDVIPMHGVANVTSSSFIAVGQNITVSCNGTRMLFDGTGGGSPSRSYTCTDQGLATGALTGVWHDVRTRGTCLQTCSRAQLPAAYGRGSGSTIYVDDTSPAVLATHAWRLGDVLLADDTPVAGLRVWMEAECTGAGAIARAIASYTCDANGTWNRTACRAVCLVPSIPHADISMSSRYMTRNESLVVVNDSITVKCMSNARLLGDATMRCTMSGWNDQTTCEPVLCPSIALPSFVHPSHLPASSPGTTIAVRCNRTDYTLNGQQNITCKENYEWNNINMNCTAIDIDIMIPTPTPTPTPIPTSSSPPQSTGSAAPGTGSVSDLSGSSSASASANSSSTSLISSSAFFLVVVVFASISLVINICISAWCLRSFYKLRAIRQLAAHAFADALQSHLDIFYADFERGDGARYVGIVRQLIQRCEAQQLTFGKYGAVLISGVLTKEELAKYMPIIANAILSHVDRIPQCHIAPCLQARYRLPLAMFRDAIPAIVTTIEKLCAVSVSVNDHDIPISIPIASHHVQVELIGMSHRHGDGDGDGMLLMDSPLPGVPSPTTATATGLPIHHLSSGMSIGDAANTYDSDSDSSESDSDEEETISSAKPAAAAAAATATATATALPKVVMIAG